MTVSLTESAAARVATIAMKLGKPAILRLAVDGGGCSGFQYRFGLADVVESDDIVTAHGDVRLVVVLVGRATTTGACAHAGAANGGDL